MKWLEQISEEIKRSNECFFPFDNEITWELCKGSIEGHEYIRIYSKHGYREDLFLHILREGRKEHWHYNGTYYNKEKDELYISMIRKI